MFDFWACRSGNIGGLVEHMFDKDEVWWPHQMAFDSVEWNEKWNGMRNEKT